MKKTIVCLLAVIIMAVSPLSGIVSAAQEPISVVLDGVELDFDAQPRIVNSRTLVPLRGIFEAMGATVLWNGATKTVTALRLDSVVKLTVGGKEATVNKEKRQLDVPAQIFEDRTFVPVRFISESMGAEVGWDNETRTVIIETDRAHWTDPGDNLTANLLFTSKWVSIQSGEEMTFDPEKFIEISDTWEDNPKGLFYSYSDTSEGEMNIVRMFLDGGHLKDHYLEFDPDSRILSEYLKDDVIASWHIKADMSEEEAEDALREGHEDVLGEYEYFSYMDEDNRLLLSYPGSFSSFPIEMDGRIMSFPSRVDDTYLLYWVLPNTEEETEESFVENTPAEEIAIYNNVVIGWKNDLNQVTGEMAPYACFWVIEPEWIVCVAIICNTEEQAAEWCRKMIDETAILISRY